MHYAGLLAYRPRSAAGLAAMLADYFQVPVEVLPIPGAMADVRTRPINRSWAPRMATACWATAWSSANACGTWRERSACGSGRSTTMNSSSCCPIARRCREQGILFAVATHAALCRPDAGVRRATAAAPRGRAGRDSGRPHSARLALGLEHLAPLQPSTRPAPRKPCSKAAKCSNSTAAAGPEHAAHECLRPSITVVRETATVIGHRG